MLYTARLLHALLQYHPVLVGYNHAPPFRRGCVVTVPAYNNGMCVWRATRCFALCGLYIANAPMGGYRLFINASLAANYMVTP